MARETNGHDHHSPKPISIICYLPVPPSFSLYPTLRCKNKENLMDQKSHTWAPLNIECPHSIFLQLWLRVRFLGKLRPNPKSLAGDKVNSGIGLRSTLA